MNSSPASTLTDHLARLGVTFNDWALLERALTHRSYLNEHPDEPLQDNERLEFLGDAVLDFLAAEWLYEDFPDMDEGGLTRLRAGLVRNETLAGFAEALGIGEALRLGKGEEEGGGRSRPSNLGSAFEALAGALYLDRGMDAVRRFARPWFDPVLEAMLQGQSDKDAKSRLQEWSHATLNQTPIYHIVNVAGPEHAPEFTFEVMIGGRVFGTGKGRSKQAAAQAAAQEALAALQNKRQSQ